LQPVIPPYFPQNKRDVPHELSLKKNFFPENGNKISSESSFEQNDLLKQCGYVKQVAA
jgi:hypothetical protein